MDTGGLNLTAISNHPLTFGTNNAPRMTITSGGDTQLSGNNLDIKGTSSGNTSIRINDSTGTVGTNSFDLINDGTAAYLYNRANTSMIFGTNNTERMRVTSGGALEIKGSSTDANSQAFITNDNNITIIGSSTSGSVTKDMSFHTGAERMRITSGGIVKITSEKIVGTGNGINFGGSVYAIDNNGTVADNSSYLGYSSGRWIAVYAVTGTIQTSDVREKTEIKSTQLGLDFVNDLNPVSYKWIDVKRQKGDKNIKDERSHQGLIAQEVAETLEKHGINKNEFGGLDIQKTDKYEDFHGMSYEQLIAPMIKAIQELKAEVDKLKQECKCKN
jgi:uncharacterized protein YaiE (UPF0345 family)